jgi:hypothetical protein
VSADFGQFAASHGVFVIPTLSILYSVCGAPDGPSVLQEADTMKLVRAQFRTLLTMPAAPSKLSCAAAPEAVRQLFADGVPLLSGTDSPGPGTTYGALVAQRVGAPRQGGPATDRRARSGDVGRRPGISSERPRTNQDRNAGRPSPRRRRPIAADSRYTEHRRDMEARRACSAPIVGVRGRSPGFRGLHHQLPDNS